MFHSAAYTGEIVGGIVGASLLIITAIVLILYRNSKYEQELDSLLWKVNYKDVQIKEQTDGPAGANEAPAKCTKVGNCLLQQKLSLISSEEKFFS